MENRITLKKFFDRDCLLVAPDLIGKIIACNLTGTEVKLRISETEAYRGTTDSACHAHKGRTKRTETLYMEAGTIYIYLCYGMHLLLNIVTSKVEDPQAVLIRACIDENGPGKLTKKLGITKDLNQTSIVSSPNIWLEDDDFHCKVSKQKRVGIPYATIDDQNKLWRYVLLN